MSNHPANPAALPPPYFESPDRRFRLYQGDCLDLLPRLPAESFDLIFADPPYFLSNGGITCHAGKMVSVNKGAWDRSRGFAGNYEFTKTWLAACRRIMKPDASLWVSGTSHIIHIVGCILDELGFKILNDVTWVKPNPPPNLSCRYFTHATETIIWARRDEKGRHKFNYALMKRLNGGKQMKSVWEIPAPASEEKVFGKHPTQKPLALLERIIAASSDEGDLVLDPFSGSATTGIAAARLGRAYAGVEMDEPFLRVAICRLIGVPQADNPERILATILAHAGPDTSPSHLAETLGVTERQVHYCRQAAALLGLLCCGKEGWRLTEAGLKLCSQTAAESGRMLAGIMTSHPLVQMAIGKMRRLRDGESRRNAVARLLFASTALSESTCQRRAQTLLAWIAWAEARLKGREELLFADVPSPSEEPDDVAVA